MKRHHDLLPMSVAVSPKNQRPGRGWRNVLLIIILPLVFGAMLWAASVLSDNGRVPSELAAAKQESGVMLCADGKIVHGAGEFFDRLLNGGTFRCTSWRMRQTQVDTATGATYWPSSPRR
jgi:hypothetical protein